LATYSIPSCPGREPPGLIYVVIEIPKGIGVKYEVDTRNGILYADRILPTSVVYPCNYGFIPNTMERNSSDPVDVFVIENESLFPFSVISARPLGVIVTEDQDGNDNKIIAVPDNRVDPEFASIVTISDIPLQFRKKLEYFVNHHKDLEEGKFVRVTGWGGKDLATAMIQKSIDRYQKKLKKKTTPD
jgi:inorganic pyrophosphatase